ncbi:unnamed protein product [Notodromas monacha]|uniref:Uncharacterized protein n=1 Tax=Notodromas monacha TaxID=399045 RepID=A0A7R9C0D8_9CRUS|nr:unnamed protein product [Notodromas monacha]CAG0923869.1 unnamed protein product [Notodromas monacha]
MKRRNEYITWSNPPCCVHNIIVGKLWYEQYGQMEIENHTTKYRCSLTFRSAGWFSKNLHAVEGFVLDERKQRMKFLYGRWVDIFKSIGVQDYEDYAKNNDNKIRKQRMKFLYGRWVDIFKSIGVQDYEDYAKNNDNKIREEPPSSPMHGGERSKEDESVSPGKRSGRKMLSKLNSLTSSVSSAMHSLGPPSFSIDTGSQQHPLDKVKEN